MAIVLNTTQTVSHGCINYLYYFDVREQLMSRFTPETYSKITKLLISKQLWLVIDNAKLSPPPSPLALNVIFNSNAVLMRKIVALPALRLGHVFPFTTTNPSVVTCDP